MCDLPELEICEDFTKWDEYEDRLFTIFKKEFVLGHTIYNNLKVTVNLNPIENNKFSSFYHLTCKNYEEGGSRNPDPDRAERIRWPKYLIEKELCEDESCGLCPNYLSWEVENPKWRMPRVLILVPPERYVVILEKKINSYHLVTAYYLHDEYGDRRINKLLNSYANTKKRLT